MEVLLEQYKPPNTPALTIDEVKEWENGIRTLTPDQIASARELQLQIAEQNQARIVQGELVQAVGILATNSHILSVNREPMPQFASV